MPAMDAIALLENLDIKVKVIGMGKGNHNHFKREKII
jgi:hypothetical protein